MLTDRDPHAFYAMCKDLLYKPKSQHKAVCKMESH